MLPAVAQWLMTVGLLAKRRLRLRCHPAAQRGFVLPLAIGTSLVLLLGSASVHTLALHARLRARSNWQLQERRDQLRSAAMAFVELAADPAQDCLLATPKQGWEAIVESCSGADPFPLEKGVVGSVSWMLLDWQPTLHGAELTLALSPAGAAGRLALRRRDGHLVLQPGLQLLPEVGAQGPIQEGQP